MRDPLVNQQIRQYFIQERLQAGGMAVVYKAFDQQRKELVAFKVLRENYADQPQTTFILFHIRIETNPIIHNF